MQSEAFMAGVIPGAPNTDYEVRILICWLLREIGTPVTPEQLNTALTGEGLVNYFELAGAIGQLVSTGHLTESFEEHQNRKVHLLSLSELGSKTAETFRRDIPRTVRDKAAESLRRCILLERFERENLAEITETEDGFCLTLAIRDVGNDLLRLSLYAPTREVCETMRGNFVSDPTVVYRAVLASLMGEKLRDISFLGHQTEAEE